MVPQITSRVINNFSSINSSSPIPIVTLANGSKTLAQGVDQARPIPFLSLAYVLSLRVPLIIYLLANQLVP